MPDEWAKGGGIFENRYRYDSDDEGTASSWKASNNYITSDPNNTLNAYRKMG